MLKLTTGQIESWLALYLWPFVRIGACFMTAPIFGAQFVPPRIRLFLAGAVTLIIAPLLTPSDVAIFSGAGFVVTAHQVIIGLATGFVFQLIFDALSMGGQLLSNSMGLGFAFNVDPLRGASTPVIGTLYMLMVTLTFLALNGHLMLIEVFAEGFKTLPVGPTGFGSSHMWSMASWGSELFAGSLAVALPGMTALLVVNVAFGVMSRAAPSLNLFAIGFPITLIFGLIVIYVGLPNVQSTFQGSMERAFELIGSLLQPR
jgi:flagellar biosynthetic protein FliR